jgi:hypothetical protein
MSITVCRESVAELATFLAEGLDLLEEFLIADSEFGDPELGPLGIGRSGFAAGWGELSGWVDRTGRGPAVGRFWL